MWLDRLLLKHVFRMVASHIGSIHGGNDATTHCWPNCNQYLFKTVSHISDCGSSLCAMGAEQGAGGGEGGPLTLFLKKYPQDVDCMGPQQGFMFGVRISFLRLLDTISGFCQWAVGARNSPHLEQGSAS